MKQKEKIDQRQLSKTLVLAFKTCVNNMMAQKEVQIKNTQGTSFVNGTTAPKHLKNIDKIKIIESFVENDKVLGQLLDFISQRNGQVSS